MKHPLHLNYNSAKLRICVDSVDGSVVSGRVFSQRLKEVLVFPDLNSLVLRLDRLMDEQNYPQAFQRKRTFRTMSAAAPPLPKEKNGEDDEGPVADETDDRPYMDEETVARARGEKATFVLQVLSRQNTNWQGHVDFLDGAGSRAFESELGFLALVNAMLSDRNT
ncbi:MAG: hypothetical protein LBP73_03485 [Clostridiales Family XIII bacterium]|jgi:hypothetical protein|nr:hypothetical protein [Clostridiales Family XIII bacterium]